MVARDDGVLVGFVNVIWDGLCTRGCKTRWSDPRGHGIGTQLVATAREGARVAGCEWLHVDFDEHLRHFYFDACGFTPTTAGLIALQ